LDPTRGEQLGNLDSLEQGNFGLGLPLTEKGSPLVAITPEGQEWNKIFTDTFDLVSDEKAILFNSEFAYFGGEADGMKAWLQRDGKADIELSFLNYFKDLFPEFISKEAMRVEVDEDAARIAFLLSYEIPNAWKAYPDEGYEAFEAFPYEVKADFPTFVGADRTTPFQIEHPVKSKQVQRYILDEIWEIENALYEVEFDSFSFSKNMVFENGIHTETYQYTSKSQDISAEDFSKTMSAINEVHDRFGVFLQNPTGWRSRLSETAIQMMITSWMVLASIIAFIASFFVFKRDQEWRAKAILYPVSPLKFTILSIATLGIFQLFWMFKNWYWIKHVAGEDISPGARTFFGNITIFSLLSRIARMEPSGYSWYPFASVFLAILFFADAILDRLIMRVDTLPDWVSLVSLFGSVILVPVAMQIKKMNTGKEDVLAHYARFDLPAIALILLYLPATAIVWFGSYIILTEGFG
jgi:hypothetical protein